MLCLVLTIFLTFVQLSVVNVRTDSIENWEENAMIIYQQHPCSFFAYSKQDIPGAQQDSKLLMSYKRSPSSSSKVSILVFSYFDRKRVGQVPAGKEEKDRVIFCTAELASKSACPQAKVNKFLYEDDGDMAIPGKMMQYASILSYATPDDVIALTNKTEISLEYEVSRKGLYCILVHSQDNTVSLSIEPQHPYGKVPALLYPFLPFYGSVSLLYLVMTGAWLIKSGMHWADILPVQNYIGILLLILTLDYAFHFGIYDFYNAHGSPSSVLYFFVTLLNAARNAASIFVILIVSMGYGVVRPTLGSDMKKCVWLAVALFLSFFLFNYSLESDDPSSFAVFFFMLPVALSMTISFFWILSSISATLIHLEARRQMYKLSMYRWLKIILTIAMIATFLSVLIFGAVLHSFATSIEYQATSWESYWFIQSGWMNILYLAVFVSMSVLWRPTKNNARYGLEELPENENYDLEMVTTADAVDTGNVSPRNKSEVLFDSFSGNQSPDPYKTSAVSPPANNTKKAASTSANVGNVYSLGDDGNITSGDEESEEFVEQKLRNNEQSKLR